uniref:Uncharacterized protein n=1 Tax=viral metagenome TaxID=1070528 RepID=A0A6C0LPJ2_9ZZZZ
MYHTSIKQLKTYLKNTLFEFPDGLVIKAHKLLDQSKVHLLKKNMKKRSANTTRHKKTGAGIDTFNMRCHMGALSVIALFSHKISQTITVMDAPLLRDICTYLNIHYNPGYPPEIMCQLIEKQILTMGLVAASTIFTRVAWPTYIRLYEKCLKLPASGGGSRETTFPLRPLPLEETKGRKTRKSRETTFPLRPLPFLL